MGMQLRTGRDTTLDRLDRAHRRARERGVSGPAYRIARVTLTPLLRGWFRLRASGADNLPAEGAAIIASNHKSFLDPFFIGMSTHRRVRYMAKQELIAGPFGWLLLRLGAFPIRRGESDREALATARAILEQGGVLVMFPEGTRVEDPDALGAPHHGAGLLALQTGVPIVPAAIAGTDHLWLGPLPRPRRVRLTFLPALDTRALADRADAVTELIDGTVWPAVRETYGRELAQPGLILAGLAALGLGGGLLARRQARADPRLLDVVEPLKLRKRRRRQTRIERLKHLGRPR